MRLLSKIGIYYCFVYHGQLFLPGFLLLTEPSSCVPGAINCNKEDLTIMSSLTQDDDHQSSDVLLSIWMCNKVDMRGAKENKERRYCGFYGNEYNMWKSTKSLIHLTILDGNIIDQFRSEILPKYQFNFKSLKERKEVSRNQIVSNRGLLQALVHSDVESISKYFLSRKRRNIYGTSYTGSNWVG